MFEKLRLFLMKK